jgi:hypothetical protein
MAKTTVRNIISSNNITSDAFSISNSFDITSDGTAGLDLTTGLARMKITASATDTLLIDASDYTSNGESQLAYIYIKNFSSNVGTTVFTDSVIIKLDGNQDGTTDATLGHLAGGQSVILPYSANADIYLNADTANTVIEYMLIHAG